MSQFWYVAALSSGGDLVHRTVCTSNSGALIQYGDIFRERGSDAARGYFPADWKWADPDWEQRPLADMPPSLGGQIMLEAVFLKFAETFPGVALDMHNINVDGVSMVWFDVPVVHKRDLGLSLPAIFSLRPGYRSACSNAFRDWWLKQGYTGLEFKDPEGGE